MYSPDITSAKFRFESTIACAWRNGDKEGTTYRELSVVWALVRRFRN